MLLVAFLAAYFVPAIVAQARQNPKRLPILILNIFLGWTAIGWVVALVWAVSNRIPPPADVAAAAEQIRAPCPYCAEPILTAAVVCRFCGRELLPDWALPSAQGRKARAFEFPALGDRR